MRYVLLALLAAVQAAPRQYFTAPVPVEAMRGKQAVLETSMGTIVIELLPDLAPNQVALFMKLAEDGTYNGTAFHRVVKYGIIQGGDPLTKDPSKHASYGRGGFNQVRLESSKEKLVTGMVAAVRLPGQKDSAGSQFFICVANQPTLDGQHTVFGRIVEGLDVAAAISNVNKDPDGTPIKRVGLQHVTIRDTPRLPFVDATPEEMAQQRVTLDTSMGAIELEMWPDKAPETVRSFLQWAVAGVYDGVKFHRVVPNFVVQTGALNFRTQPLKPAQQKLIHNLAPEFTNTPNVPGIVSIARSEEANSGSTSFFICTGGNCRQLDNKYTVFGRVTAGMNVVDNIGSVAVDGETPRFDVMLRKVTVEKK
jgi:peptidyl-prolyl cis-trans isomerase B (cyclophilin B)